VDVPNVGGSITLTSNGPYTYGQIVGLQATADPGYAFSHWVVTGVDGSTVLLSNATTATNSIQVLDDFTLDAYFTAETFTVAATTLSNWVYQNTPVTTANRHQLTMTTSVTADTWGNTSYTATVVVTPTPSGTYQGLIPSSTFVAANGSGSVTPANTFAFAAGSTGTLHLIGGTVLGSTGSGGLINGAINQTVAHSSKFNGQYTVHVSVVGDVSGPNNPAVTTCVVTLRLLGDIDNNGVIQGADSAYILQKIAGGTNFWPLGPDGVTPLDLASLDIDGNGTIQGADTAVIILAVAGLPVP
jgi:hypothetical protein